MDSCYAEPTINVIDVYLFEDPEYGLQFSVDHMVDRCKSYLPDEGEKKRDAVNRKNICHQIDIFI